MAGKEIYPMQNYLDVNPEIGTISEDDAKKIFGLYALPSVPADTDFDRMPRTADTFRKAFEFDAPAVGVIIHRMTQSLDCWQFRLMPIQRTNHLTVSTMHVHRNVTPLDLAPEQAAPKTMDHFTELFTTQLVRQNKGMFLNNDFYKTPMGRQEALNQLRDIGASAILSLKLSAIQSLVSCKNAYHDRISQSPSMRKSAQEQFLSETRFFGVLGTNELGLYVINDEARSIMSTAVPSVKPDTAIFSSGDLSFVALNSKHETQFFMSGNDSSGHNISKSRLDSAGESITIRGLKIYEDEPYQMASLYSGSFEPLIRNVQIGRSFTVTPHEYLGMPNVDYSRAMSFKYWNAKKDDYTLFPAHDLVRQCCRWGPDGSLREEHWSLCDDFQEWHHGGGLGPDGKGVLDPFLYRDGPGFAVCEAVGDMEPSVLSDNFVRLFGEEFRAKSGAEVGDDVARGLDHLCELSEALYNGSIDERSQNFLAAVLLMPDNQPPEPAEGSGKAEPRWIGHTFGSPHLPYRDPRTTFLYTKEPSGAGTDDWLDGPVVLVRSKRTQAVAGYRVYAPPAQGGKVPTGDRAERVLTRWAKPNGRGAVEATDLIDDPDYTYERCPSYDKPYGYCDYPTMSYLASLHSSGDTRGWNTPTLEAVARGMAAFRTHYDLARRVFPGNLAFSESNVPDYLYTGDPDIDTATAYFHNDVLRGEHAGVVGREAARVDNDLVVSINQDYAHGDATSDMRAALSQAVRLWGAMGGSQPDEVAASMIAYIASRVKPHMQKELSDDPSALFEAYETSAIASTAAALLSFPTRKFSSFFEHFIVDWYTNKMRESPDSSESYLDQCVNLFQGILNAARFGGSASRLVTPQDLDDLVQSYRFSQETRLHPPGQKLSGSRKMETALRKVLASSIRGERSSVVDQIGSFPGEVEVGSTVASRCMRLSLNPKPFRFLSEQPEKLVGLVAWPCNPVHPLEPITEWPSSLEGRRGEAVSSAFAAAGSKRTKHGMGARRMPAGSLKRRALDPELDRFPSKGRRVASSQRPRRGADARYGPDDEDDGGDYDAGSAHRWTGSGRRSRPTHQAPQAGAIVYARMKQGGDLSSVAVVDDWNARDAWARDGLPIRNNLVQALLKSMSVSKNTVARLGSQLFVQSRVCQQQFLTWLDERLPVPDSYTYAAPFEELAMGSAVFADSRQAGNTYLAWEDMAMQFEATHKTYIGHFNCYMGSVIKDPSKICVIPDVSFKRIVKGFDGSVCTAPEDFRPERPRRDQKKVGFVFSHGPGFKATDMPAPFWTLQGKVDEKKYRLDEESSALRWPGDAYYNHLWGFGRLNQSSVLDYSSMTATIHSTHSNVTMAQGRQKNWDPTTGGYGTNGYVVKGAGHLKNWEAKSVLSVLSGKEMALDGSA